MGYYCWILFRGDPAMSYNRHLEVIWVYSSSWPIQSLTMMRSALLFFCVACGWQWITVTKRGMPSVAIWLWRDVESRHVTLDDVFTAQFGSASSTRWVTELAVEDILGQATIFHTMDVASPVQTLLPYDCSEVYEPVRCRMVELGSIGTWSQMRQFISVYFCIPTKHKILYQEYRDRKRRP